MNLADDGGMTTAKTTTVTQALMDRLADARRDWAAKAAERARAQRLAQDLATYTRPAEIEDMLAMLDRGDGPEVEQMRKVLQDNLTRYYRLSPSWAS